MAKQHDKQFKLDAVQYYQDHKYVNDKAVFCHGIFVQGMLRLLQLVKMVNQIDWPSILHQS